MAFIISVMTAKPAFAFFDVNTRRATRILDLENRPAKEAPGLAISPDKGTTFAHYRIR